MAGPVVTGVHEHQLWLEGQELKTVDQSRLVFFEPQSTRRLTPLESCSETLEEGELVLIGFTFLRGLGFLGLVLQSADPVTDDFQVGKEHLLAKLAELCRHVAGAVSVQDDKQPSRFAKDTQPARIVAPLRGEQPRRVQELDRSRSRFLGSKVGRQPFQTFIGNLGHANLPTLTGGRVRLYARQPLEDGALPRSGKTDDANFHVKNQ